MAATAPSEFEQRLAGASYEEIARAGGGIVSTVKATRQASTDAAGRGGAAAARRPDRRRRHHHRDQIRLRPRTRYRTPAVAGRAPSRRASARSRFAPPFSARTRVPAEMAGRQGRLYRCGLQRDAAGDRRRGSGRCGRCVLRRHRLLGRTDRAGVRKGAKRSAFRVRLHADQLSNLHGAALAARFGALSADHLEYADEDGVAAMAQGRHRRRGAAGRVLFHPRTSGAADRRDAPPWRADRACDRQQSRHFAADLAAARR